MHHVYIYMYTMYTFIIISHIVVVPLSNSCYATTTVITTTKIVPVMSTMWLDHNLPMIKHIVSHGNHDDDNGVWEISIKDET